MIKATLEIPVSASERAKMAAAEAAENELAARAATAERNRKAGKPAPTPGSKLYVATVRGLKVRGRGGLVFSETPAEVTVIDADDVEVLKKQKAGAYVVNAAGAEQILDDCNGTDKGLTFWPSKPGEPLPLADATTDALEAELGRRRASVRDAEPRIGTAKK